MSGWRLDTEALELAEGLGFRLPRGFVLADADDLAEEISALGGDRVAVKAMSPGIVHKAELGGVRIVAARPEAVRAAVAAIGEVWPGEPPDFLVQEYVAHDAELLLGMRRTADFGPIVILGPGGIRTEALAARHPAAFTIASPAIGAAPDDDLLSRMLTFAAAAPADIAEFEINPLVLTGAGPVALDATLRVRSDEPEPAANRPLDKMSRLLEPESVAIVGVSREENIGRVILRNVLRAGFPADRLLVVKPGVDEIDGCRCVPDLAALTAPVDLLVVSVDAAQVPDLVEQVVRLRCAESVILIPGGLGEKEGTEAAAVRVRTAVDVARGEPWRGPLVNGGNCLGIDSRPGCIDTFFIPERKMSPGTGREQPVAVVSQSGAMVLSRLDRVPWLAPRYVISVGNQIDLTVGDHLTHLAHDPEVAVAACYVEGFRPGDGLRFLDAAQRIRRRGGAVVLYRAGRTAAGAGAAASHTSSIAGDYAVTCALAGTAGVLVADTLADFTDLLMLAVLLRDRRVDGLRLGAVSNAGFEMVAMADRLGPFSPAEFAPGTVTRLDTILDAAGIGSLVSVRNPLDLTPVAGDEAFAAAAETVLADPGVDVAAIGCVPFTPALHTLPDEGVAGSDSLASRLASLATAKAWVAVVDGGTLYDPMARRLLEAGIPTFREADRAMKLLGAYSVWRRSAS